MEIFEYQTVVLCKDLTFTYTSIPLGITTQVHI